MAAMEKDMSLMLSKIPFPEKGADEAFARGLIEMVLNATLNRYVMALECAGYKMPANLAAERGWVNGRPGKLLQVKFDIMDEAVQIFSSEIVSALKKETNQNRRKRCNNALHQTSR